MPGGRRPAAGRRFLRTSPSSSISSTTPIGVLVLGFALLLATAATAATATTTPLRRLHHHRRLLPPQPGRAAALASAAFLLPHYLSHSRRRSSSSTTTTMSAATGAASSTTLLPHLAAVRDKATVILASKSPRRVEIMGLMGLAPPAGAGGDDDEAVFRVVPSGFPEDLDKRCEFLVMVVAVMCFGAGQDVLTVVSISWASRRVE